MEYGAAVEPAEDDQIVEKPDDRSIKDPDNGQVPSRLCDYSTIIEKIEKCGPTDKKFDFKYRTMKKRTQKLAAKKKRMEQTVSDCKRYHSLHARISKLKVKKKTLEQENKE